MKDRATCAYEKIVLEDFKSSMGELSFVRLCMSVTRSRGTRLVWYQRHYYDDKYANKTTSRFRINILNPT